MAKPLLPDERWHVIEPLLPLYSPSPKGGRPRVSNRAALSGIRFVLRTGIPWEYLPALRFGHDLLATAARRAAGRCLAAPARSLAHAPAGQRSA